MPAIMQEIPQSIPSPFGLAEKKRKAILFFAPHKGGDESIRFFSYPVV